MIKLNIDGVESVEFTQTLIRVGRNKNISKEIDIVKEKDIADIFMKDKKAVSREHCEILKKDFQWYIKDLNSTNGTFLNNKRLDVEEEYPLRDRDTLSLGSDVCICVEAFSSENEEHTLFQDIGSDETSLDFGDSPKPMREELKTVHNTNEVYFLESLNEEHKGGAFELNFSQVKEKEFLQLLNINHRGEISFIFSGSNIVLENHSSFQVKVNNKDIDREKVLFDGNIIDIDSYRFIFVERTSRRIIGSPVDLKQNKVEHHTPSPINSNNHNQRIKTRVIRESVNRDNEPTISLVPSTTLNSGQYKIIQQLGEAGGFGITYLAEDTKLNSKVAIKEYFPRMYADRDRRNSISPIESKDSKDNFEWGYDAFKKEAQTIANIPRHDNVITVKNLFEENGTVYYVMDYTEGEDLESYLKSKHPLTQKEIENILFPLFEGVKHIHKHDILHRDIKLSNILITTSGEPILIDFGTARNQFIQRSKKLTTVYTEGYAAIEQHTGGNEGEYTDIYAIGMVVYAMINGITDTDKLPSSVKRLDNKHNSSTSLLKFPTKGGRVSKDFIKAVKKAIEIQHKDRPQSLDAMIKLFRGVQSSSSNKSYLFVGIATTILLIGLSIILNLS